MPYARKNIARFTRNSAVILGISINYVWATDITELYSQDLDSLLSLELETASRTLEPLGQTPAAAQIITQEDIEASSAQVIPELLRFVPGIEAFQITPALWSVSSRGFSGRYANKLLVLVDGQSIYNSIYNGVYWEAHAIPLEEVKRIEVVRGPGTALWGSNAVNGVINIITKHTADTQGAQTTLGIGSKQSKASLNWGDKLSDDARYRFSLHHDQNDGFSGPLPFNPDTQHQRSQIRTRLDWNSSPIDELSAQAGWSEISYENGGLFLDTNVGFDEALNREESSTRNAFGALSWKRTLSGEQQIKLRVSHQELVSDGIDYHETNKASQIDFQHSFSASKRHSVVWGASGKRSTISLNSENFQLQDPNKHIVLNNSSIFLQDKIRLTPKSLNLIVGGKLEKNSFTDKEWQPQARLIWMPQLNTSVWASVAKASRTPSILERYWRTTDFVAADVHEPHNPFGIPIYASLVGSKDFESEHLTAYEIGGRTQLSPSLSLDAAFYVNEYKTLRDWVFESTNFAPDAINIDLTFNNGIEGTTQGIELQVNWLINQQWDAQFNYHYIDYDLESNNPLYFGVTDTTAQYVNLGPNEQASTRIRWTPNKDFQAVLSIRYVEGFSQHLFDYYEPKIKSYTEADFTATWEASPKTTLQLSGKNLLNDKHAEYSAENWHHPQLVPRSVFVSLSYEF